MRIMSQIKQVSASSSIILGYHKNMDKLSFEEVDHNPEEPLPQDHVALLADLLIYCAEVMIAVRDPYDPLNMVPAGTEMDHGHTSAFENAVGLLLEHELVVPLTPSDTCPYYRLTIPLSEFPRTMFERYRSGKLKYDDFNRALEAPLHLARQTYARANKNLIGDIIKGLRELGLVEGPEGESVWTDKTLLYAWFSAYGYAVNGASYYGANDFEQFYSEAES